MRRRQRPQRLTTRQRPQRPTGLRFQMPGPGKWQRKFRSTEFPISRGSFSSVSTLLIARVSAFCSMFRDLQDWHVFPNLCTALIKCSPNFESQGFSSNVFDFSQMSAKSHFGLSTIFIHFRTKCADNFSEIQFHKIVSKILTS